MARGAVAAPAAPSPAATELAGPEPPYVGYLALLHTPFTPTDRIDDEDMDRQIEFCIRAGAGALVWPQLFGEFFALSDDERRRVGARIMKRAGRRCPVIIGVQAPEEEHVHRLSRHAVEQGASAVITLPPYHGRSDEAAALDFFRRLGGIVKTPVFIQNTGNPWGLSLSPKSVLTLARENPRLGFIKEESKGTHKRLAEYARAGIMPGIFSGNSGKDIFRELVLGAHGSFGSTPLTDVHARIFQLARSGRDKEARALHQKAMCLQEPPSTEIAEGLELVKWCLVKRGIFKTAKLRRVAQKRFDAVDEREMEAWWEELAPHLIVRSV
jgi:2-keto-3-deoxy-L-arabinonate dehydratase